MNALELADMLAGTSKDFMGTAEMLRRQHEAIKQLREALELTPNEVAQMWIDESFDTMTHESCYVRGVKRGEQAVWAKLGVSE